MTCHFWTLFFWLVSYYDKFCNQFYLQLFVSFAVEKLGKTTFGKSWAKQLLGKVGQKALRLEA
jgi:hypothetical protein